MRMLIVAGVVVSAAAGCGDETIDEGKVEDFIRDHAPTPALIAAIECPDEEEVEEGARFECGVETARGGREVAAIRQTGDGDFVWVGNRVERLPRGQRYAVPENVEDYIRTQAEEPEKLVSVDCPPDVPLKKGTTFDCVARFVDGSATEVELEQVDRLGNVKLTGTSRRAG